MFSFLRKKDTSLEDLVPEITLLKQDLVPYKSNTEWLVRYSGNGVITEAYIRSQKAKHKGEDMWYYKKLL